MPTEEKTSMFQRFCENVSIPTARNLTAQYNTKVRILTCIVVIIMTGLTVYQIYDRARYYITNPINVVVTESDEDSGVLPVMVICPPGQFRVSMAEVRAYGGLGSRHSDLINMEKHRDAIISSFQRTNLSFNSSYVDQIIQDLKSIYEDVSSGTTDDELSSVLARLDDMANILQNTLPLAAAILNTKEPVQNGIMLLDTDTNTITNSFVDPLLMGSFGDTTTTNAPLNKNSSITGLNGYAKFREWNGLYDSCATNSFLFPVIVNQIEPPQTWNQLIRRIVNCRIHPTESDLIADLKLFPSYPRLLNLGRPSVKDVVLDCDWYNSKALTTNQSCNVTSVWTPLGKCFRIASADGNSSVTSLKSGGYANVLIDTLTAEFPYGQTKVFFYSQDETEFATASGGIPIEPGLKSGLSVELMRQYTRAEKNCGTTILRHFKSYSRDKCIWEKSTEPVEQKCNCLYDGSPNYFQKAEDEITKMEMNFTYNSTLNFCSFYDTYFCAPNVINTTDYDCPNDCENVQPEVSWVTNTIDPRKTFTRLPPGFDNKVASVTQNLSIYGGYFNAPGTDQLNILLSELFQNHLVLISAFWWKNRTEFQPFYLPWFLEMDSYNSATVMNKFDFYFNANRSSTPISKLPFEFDYSILNRTDQYYSSFTKLIADILAKYNNHLNDMTDGGSYTNQTLRPFYDELLADLDAAESATDEFSKVRLLVLNKFIDDFKPFYECTTKSEPGQSVVQCFSNYGCDKRVDSSESETLGIIFYQFNNHESNENDAQIETSATNAREWTPMCICELHNFGQQLVLNNITSLAPGGKLKAWIDDMTMPQNGTEFSMWTAPWDIYYKWFRNEIPDHGEDGNIRSKSIAQAFSSDANTTDVFQITNNYRSGSNAREELRKAHLGVARAMGLFWSPLFDIRACPSLIAKLHFID